MPKLLVTDVYGVEAAVEATPGSSIMAIIRSNGFDELQAQCGGQCACATCHVYVDPVFAAALPPMDGDEQAMLDGAAHVRATSRLSCQIRFTAAMDGLRVTIAPDA